MVESMSVDEYSLWVEFLLEQAKATAKNGTPTPGGSKAVRRKLR